MRRVGALIFPGFELLDLFGPLQMLGMLKDEFEIHLLAEEEGAVISGQGPQALATKSIKDPETFEVLLVPGGAGTRREVHNEALLSWIVSTAAKADHVLSVCTGSALLAKAGVLDGRRATTNKMAFHWVTEQGPNVLWQKEARWVEDDRFITASGVSAGMDMTLSALSTMLGEPMARQVEKWCEYTWHDDPDLDPFAALNGLT